MDDRVAEPLFASGTANQADQFAEPLYVSDTANQADRLAEPLYASDTANQEDRLAVPLYVSEAANQSGKETLLLHCPNCTYFSNKKSNLKRHMRTNHNQELQTVFASVHQSGTGEEGKGFLCEVCGKDYASKAGLRLHIKDKHSSDCRFKCNICGAGFNRVGDFKGHMNKHQGEKEICTVCGQQFQYKTSLRKHQRKCHSNEPIAARENFLCSFCGVAVSSRDSLREHVGEFHAGKSFVDLSSQGSACSWRSGHSYHYDVWCIERGSSS